MLSLILLLSLAVVPQASLSSPDSAQAGTTVLLDARASVADFPLAWTVTPPGPTLLKMDQDGRTSVVALFTATEAGEYDVVLAASGWTDQAKQQFGLSVAAHRIVVGAPVPPTPPAPPLPTDPMALAGLKYHSGLDGAYSDAYAVAARSAGAAVPPTLASIYATLNSQVTAASSAANASAFAPWQSQMPPSGTEPTSPAQWALLKAYFSSLSQAFGSKN